LHKKLKNNKRLSIVWQLLSKQLKMLENLSIMMKMLLKQERLLSRLKKRWMLLPLLFKI